MRQVFDQVSTDEMVYVFCEERLPSSFVLSKEEDLQQLCFANIKILSQTETFILLVATRMSPFTAQIFVRNGRKVQRHARGYA